MREIKFRGKRTDNGEWVVGCLLYLRGSYWIYSIYEEEKRFLVDENTVGQCTGLKDKNGKEIFEGDLLNGYGGKKRFFKVVYFENEACFLLRNVLNEDNVLPLMIQDCDKWIVAGNIHDNKELLNEK